jgi:hypothetical protein
VFRRNLEGSVLAIGQFTKELVDWRQQAVGNLCLLQAGLGDNFDVTVGFQVGVECADVVLFEGNQVVLLPAIAVDGWRLLKAVVLFEAINNGVLDRTETRLPGELDRNRVVGEDAARYTARISQRWSCQGQYYREPVSHGGEISKDVTVRCPMLAT